MGKTYEGRDHIGIKISSGGKKKPAIVVDGGIHAREWLAPAQVLYIIHQLVENPANKDYFSLVDWYLVPVLNPDGYEYTFTTVSSILLQFVINIHVKLFGDELSGDELSGDEFPTTNFQQRIGVSIF